MNFDFSKMVMGYAVLTDDHKVVPAKSPQEWAEFFDKHKRVAEDRIGDYWISTVFLGIDHGFGGKSLWFETMVFNEKQDSWADFQERYSTWDEAVEGHKEAVRQVKGWNNVSPKNPE